MCRKIERRNLQITAIIFAIACFFNVCVWSDELPQPQLNADQPVLGLRHEMNFSWIPPGEKIKKNRNGSVSILKEGVGFYLGVYEVTQADWKRVMGEEFEQVLLRQDKEGLRKIRRYLGGGLPVYCLTIDDSRNFLKMLNDKERKEFGDNSWAYRLPSASEWEYAARSRKGQEYVTGSVLMPDAGVFKCGQSALLLMEKRKLPKEWYVRRKELIDNDGPINVGTRSIKNVHGLHDIHGNVAELTSTLSDERLEDFPAATLKGPLWVTKGGGWMSIMDGCAFSETGITARNSTNLPTGIRLLAELRIREKNEPTSQP